MKHFVKHEKGEFSIHCFEAFSSNRTFLPVPSLVSLKRDIKFSPGVPDSKELINLKGPLKLMSKDMFDVYFFYQGKKYFLDKETAAEISTFILFHDLGTDEETA